MGLFTDSAPKSQRRLGLGGFHIGKIADPETAVELVRYAVDAGFAMLDNSWDYHGGESERRVGRALSQGDYRQRALVMTKVDSRTYDGVMRQFAESLDRLGLSSIDLLQLHEVIRPTDAHEAVTGGALRALAELRDQGAVGHIGITGHKDPHYLVDLIDRAAESGVRIETAQMPISPVDHSAHGFSAVALPACLERGVEVLGMKPLGAAVFLEGGALSAIELLRWTLDQPVAACITGCESVRDVDQAIEAVHRTALSRNELRDLESRAEELLQGGRLNEPYKSTERHDATARNPEWLA